MDMTIKRFMLALLLAPIVLMGEKFPSNKGDEFPFHKSQLDSRMLGVVGPIGLWTHYHSEKNKFYFKAQEKKRDTS